MAVLKAMSSGRSLWSLLGAGSTICFGRFRIKVSRDLVLSQCKTSENAVRKESKEDGTETEAISTLASTSLAYKRKAVEAEISLFLKSRGMTHLQAVKIISKLDWCIKLVICDLHASRRTCTVHAIKSAIIPYVEALLRENRESLLHLNEPDPSTGELQPDLFYLLEQLNLSQIKLYVNFLLESGASDSTIAKILGKFPRFCSLNMSENIEPMTSLLIRHGLNKDKLPKVIDRRLELFYISYEKAELILNYLCALGLPKERVGKVIEKFPSILSYSIDNLETKVEYFQALGVDLVKFVSVSPQCLALSLEKKIKPVTKFFFDRGFSKEEWALMLSRHGMLYAYSLKKNIMPKWAFFLEMGNEREVLVSFPAYFSCSLEKRIKPRYERMIETGVQLPFPCFVSSSDEKFEQLINRKCVIN